jgi:molybdate transport system substrate-binding protein
MPSPFHSLPMRILGIALLGIASSGPARADELRIAVAANFAGPIQKIAPAFEQASGHKLLVSLGATGKFYAQIKSGARFDVLLAADDETPRKLEAEGDAVAGTRFTYAIGKLVLWSARPGYVDAQGEVLKQGDFAHIALGNPRLVPYGLAATETLTKLGIYKDLAPRFVMAESIAQAHQFVSTGNAELGFVALSQVIREGAVTEGSAWIVPPEFYAPLRQDAVVLSAASRSPAVAAWMRWLQGDAARALIKTYGYALP